MTADEKRDLQQRAKRAISAPVPSSIAGGTADASRAYKDCAAVVAAFLRTGHQADRARLHLLRLEGMQGLLR